MAASYTFTFLPPSTQVYLCHQSTMTAGMAAGAASAVHFLQSGVAVMEAEEPMVVSQQLFTLDRGIVYSLL